MKPILVHIHVFYPDMWWYVRRHLQSLLTYHNKIFITTVKDYPEIREDVSSLGINAQFIEVENRGYDVAPFLQVLKQVNLDEYSFIIKMHTKRDVLGRRFWIQGYEMTGAAWREYMYDFLKCDNIHRCIDAFAKDPKLGMTSNFRLVLDYEPAEDKCWQESLRIIQNCLNIHNNTYSFVAGSMFMCRAHLMKPLQQLEFTSSDFEEHKAHNITTLAHIIERILGLVVCAQGYSIRDCYTPFIKRISATGTKNKIWRNWLLPRKEFRKKLKNFHK